MAVGGIIRESKKVTSNYTIIEQDEIIYVDTSGGAITLTLAKPTNDNLVTIKIVDSTFATTIITEDNKTIDGASSYTLTSGSISLAYFIDGSANEFKVIGGETNKGYKVYNALLSQTGTDNPTTVVLKNELDNDIVWVRSTPFPPNTGGSYLGTLTGAFTSGKTFILSQSTYGTTQTSTFVYWSSVNGIQIETFSLSDGFNVDEQLYETSIEIRVYN